MSYVDLAQAVEISGRSRMTLYRRIQDGTLPAVKDGNKYLVDEAILRKVFEPQPVVSADERMAAEYAELQAAARKIAAKAPPLSAAMKQELSSILSEAELAGGGARV